MRRIRTLFVCLAIPALVWAAEATPKLPHSVAGDPSLVARTVVYHEKDVAEITTAMFVQTIVIFPQGEKILDAGCGDRDDWPINWTENVLYVKSAVPGGKTTINVFTSSGTVYSFFASDVSNVAGAHPDAKVFLQLAGDLARTAQEGPKFVSVEELAAARRQAQLAEETSKQAQETITRQAQEQQEKYRSQYPGKLQFDYHWNATEAAKLGIQQVFHDEKFTYIRASQLVGELPVVYEIKDGKHSLINAPFQNGIFTIQKIVESGEIVVGKKKVEFFRRAS
jgi:type IV secretory pathway VirB9-like protein